MNDVNRSRVTVNLRDVGGKTIKDQVDLKFYNQRAQSLNQRFPVEFKGRPVTLGKVPAFPFGLTQVFINPTKYRYKSIFVNVPAGKPGLIDETCFVEPGQVKPVFPSFREIRTKQRWAHLWRILRNSGITTVSAWNGLSDEQKAGLFNIYAKTQREIVGDEKPVVGFIERITEFRSARIFTIVQTALLGLVRSYPKGFQAVSGALHNFPDGWNLIDPDGSFKTHDSAGNLQLTFAEDAAGQFMTDIDIDDHQGIEHAADVLKHKITGKDTHPYDIHQILVFFQGIDPGYDFA
ncbi:MAG: hypothetical protein ACE5JX_03740 [Acidobacteriota bacterium]